MPEQGSAPNTAVDEGALYTKDTSGTQLFWKAENNGTEQQITGTGGSLPIILSGTVALTTTSSNVAIVPANSWGLVFFTRQSDPTQIQDGFFWADGSKAYAYSHKLKQNGSGSFDIYISLINDPTATLNIKANTDSSSFNGNWNYKVIYWK